MDNLFLGRAVESSQASLERFRDFSKQNPLKPLCALVRLVRLLLPSWITNKLIVNCDCPGGTDVMQARMVLPLHLHLTGVT